MKQKVFLRIFLILNNFFLAFQYIGCYFTLVDCDNNDGFIEMGIDSTECSNSISSLSDMKCSTGKKCAYNYVESKDSMTVDICFHICNPNGFKYAGLSQ